MSELVSTGIPRMDEILAGGLRRGTCTLLEGIPGTGKTTVGLQFIHHGAVREDEPGLVITFEQFPEQMIADAARLGWDLEGLDAERPRSFSISSARWAAWLIAWWTRWAPSGCSLTAPPT